jgi:hypothetical protein
MPGLNKKPAREVKEEDLLNDIEASTKRLYQQVAPNLYGCKSCLIFFIQTICLIVLYLVSLFYHSLDLSQRDSLSIQSRNLNDESKTHIHLLNKVESDMTAESIALRAGKPRPSRV